METASVDNLYSRRDSWREEWMGLFMYFKDEGHYFKLLIFLSSEGEAWEGL